MFSQEIKKVNRKWPSSSCGLEVCRCPGADFCPEVLVGSESVVSTRIVSCASEEWLENNHVFFFWVWLGLTRYLEHFSLGSVPRFLLGGGIKNRTRRSQHRLSSQILSGRMWNCWQPHWSALRPGRAGTWVNAGLKNQTHVIYIYTYI